MINLTVMKGFYFVVISSCPSSSFQLTFIPNCSARSSIGIYILPEYTIVTIGFEINNSSPSITIGILIIYYDNNKLILPLFLAEYKPAV